ncbi:hypothetical protein [Streptomyces fulvoviolaceus]|uniref:hypothetical protein n=1 Tax=Streptomyces fulvoviolaceus TaxID=285535 RepID=UPI0021C1FAC7|nr:hypothetical protein [Streptomyces fulvoviolaceus]MCT9076870.1 hypothetical protein [Streptomyces fulvoviolaceus]
MSEQERQEAGDERDFEDQVRELLAEDAYTIRPSPVPYPAIRRRGMVERRRRVAVAGAVLVTLTAVPVGAYAMTGGGSATQRPQTLTSTTQSVSPTPTVSASPSRAVGPATPGQLVDGVTLEQARDGVEDCLAFEQGAQAARPKDMRSDLGDPADYRILLALKSTGDSNAPGDGFAVVAVREKSTPVRLICTVKDGEVSGVNTSVGEDTDPDAGLVRPDINALKLYSQSVIDKGNWKLPFRWGTIGTVDPSVTKVTATYGDGTGEVVLDHGWFVATGVLNQQVTEAPHIKGYDAGGELVYDSDTDKSYMATLP